MALSMLLPLVLGYAMPETPLWCVNFLEEPLVAASSGAHRDPMLGKVLAVYQRQSDKEDLSVFEKYQAASTASPWRGSLNLNLGMLSYHQGRFSRTIPYFTRAWELLKGSSQPNAKRQADRAIAELLRMNARIGETTRVEALLSEIKDRPMTGSSAQMVSESREALSLMQNEPESSFWCGPAALKTLRQLRGKGESEIIDAFPSTSRGTNLLDVADLAQRSGTPMALAYRSPGAQIVAPALVHWRLGHFAALTRREGDRWEVVDPTFGQSISVSKATLDAEASGYCLVPVGVLPKGFRHVGPDEAANVWGKGTTNQSDPNETRDDSESTDNSCSKGSNGDIAMAQYDIHAMLCSVRIWDTPVGYKTPFGPSIKCRLTYAQRESGQDAVFTSSNVGPNWRFWYLSYIQDNASALGNVISLHLQGGGQELFDPPAGIGTASYRDRRSRANLVRTSTTPIRYERVLPDGSKEVYAQDAGGGTARKVFLTEVVDPQGNKVTLQYNSTTLGKLESITDAGGRVTRLYYDNADPLLITRIVDPFSRQATLTYTAEKKLFSIKDRIGIVSSFTYENSASPVIKAMTTPYGTTTFTVGDKADPQNAGEFGRFVEAVDPLGRPERIEFWHSPSTDRYVNYASDVVPSGGVLHTGYSNTHIDHRNSFYWDRLNYIYNYPNYDKAKIFHWRWQSATGGNVSTGVLESLRLPLRGRLFLAYSGQPGAGNGSTTMIASSPSEVAFIDDAGVKRSKYFASYNASGRATSVLEYTNAPALNYRATRSTYSADGTDLWKVEQAAGNGISFPATAGPFDTVLQATYDRHKPATITDGAGRTTTIHYNAKGQPDLITNAKAEKTTLVYDARGLLYQVKANDGTVIATYTYDSTLRPSSVTTANGYKMFFSYDALDRVRVVRYMDNTTELFTYKKLDLDTYTDRQGRLTQYTFNAVRDLIQIRDPRNAITTLGWCRCGKLKSLLDPNGNLTTWTYDVEGRLIFKHYADGSDESYTYESKEGRLAQVTDGKGQTTWLDYFDDGRIRSRLTAGGAVAAPATSFTYDPVYPRLSSMSDGFGTTNFSYFPNNGTSLGAGRVSIVNGPLGNDTLSYTYDELGRRRTRSLNGVGASYAYDQMGNLKVEVNPLGTFTYSYKPGTHQLTATLGGQVKMAVGYPPLPADPRVASLTNRTAANAVLGSYGYQYDLQGAIHKWTQSYKQGATLGDQTFGYDASDQLQSSNVASGATQLTSFVYGYDPAGNRMGSTSDGLEATFTANSLNELTFEDEQWASPNAAATYQRTLSYDLNGNINRIAAKNETTLTTVNTDFVWDNSDQLVSILKGTVRSDFGYDGFGRRVQITESTGGVTTSDKAYTWEGLSLASEHANGQVRYYFTQGVVDFGGSKYYFARDHLGSIRQVVNAAGVTVGEYQYDPFGKRTVLSETGTYKCDLGFTGYYLHKPSGLWMSPTRLYRPESGTWMSRDPIKEDGGLNLYGYVRNTPTVLVDNSGLDAIYGDFGGVTEGASLGAYFFASSMPFNVFIGHSQGTSSGAVVQLNGKPTTAAEFAIFLLAQSEFDWSKGLVIGSCRTGIGPNSFAQEVSKYISGPVFAPSGDFSTGWFFIPGSDMVNSTHHLLHPIKGAKGDWVQFDSGQEVGHVPFPR